MKTVVVQGLGFVGSAMAVAVALAKDTEGKPLYNVIGLDLDNPLGQTRIDKINQGFFPLESEDAKLNRATQQVFGQGNLRATANRETICDADVVVVDIPLDVNALDSDNPRANLEGYAEAIGQTISLMKNGSLLLVETTVPPGTCERIIEPLIKKSAKTIHLAYSYERVMPGKDYLDSIINFWRVYAANSVQASESCKEFLSSVINVMDFPLTQLHSLTAAEMAKVLENSYRANTIAFMDEWGKLAQKLGVDLFKVVEAIRVRPTHSNIRQPGFGVGGYCLTKDPLFPLISINQIFEIKELEMPFCRQTVVTNLRMPEQVFDLLISLGAGPQEVLLILGLSYRQDVGDVRYSPSLYFAKKYKKMFREIWGTDPYVASLEDSEIRVCPLEAVPHEITSVVLAVKHQLYAGYDWHAFLSGHQSIKYVIDANSVLDHQSFIDLQDHFPDVRFARLGDGSINAQ